MSCPTAEELAGLVLGEGQPDSRRRLADHVVGCVRCAADVRLLMELDAEARLARPQAAPRRIEAGQRRWVSWLAAASLLLALAGTLPSPPGDRLRGAEAAARPRDGAVLAEAPARLEWAPELAARHYRVRFFRVDGAFLWESAPVEAAALELPPELRARLATGGFFYWTVRVEGPTLRSRLGPYWLEVAPVR
jgi:hypothetical protein